MGTTVTSQRILTESIVSELKDYGRVLRKDERALYERMLKDAYLHFAGISNAGSLNTWALVLLSIMLEQQKRIAALEDEILARR